MTDQFSNPGRFRHPWLTRHAAILGLGRFRHPWLTRHAAIHGLAKVFFLCILFVFYASAGFSIAPDEVFEAGRRAFLSAHWEEARAHFQNFRNRWPNHTLEWEARHFLTLSEIRGNGESRRVILSQKIASYTKILSALKEKLSDTDLSEISVELEVLKAQIGQSWASPTTSLDLSPSQLAHFINRKWFPFPEFDAFMTLDWVKKWEKKHQKKISPLLHAKLSLICAKALWRFRTSPLPTMAYCKKLKNLGEWPIHDACLQHLQAAFRDGDFDTKRDAALLGVAADSLKSNREKGQKKEISKWHRYLQERGVHLADSWTPQ